MRLAAACLSASSSARSASIRFQARLSSPSLCSTSLAAMATSPSIALCWCEVERAACCTAATCRSALAARMRAMWISSSSTCRSTSHSA
eukprot:scaffold2800_cov135-Isochrysis_galbana.AAC.1